MSDVKYVSADDAWEEFRTKYFGENEELADGFRNDNPLAKQAHYEIYLKDVEDQKWFGRISGILS